MSDFKNLPTVNGVPVSLEGHIHQNTISTTSEGFSVNNASIKVSASVTQAISALTNTKLALGSIDHLQVPASWVAATNRYVAQSNGIYRLIGAARINANNRSAKLMIYKNGVFALSLQDNVTAGSNNAAYNGYVDLQLVAGDYIELWFYASGSCTIQTIDTFFCASRTA